MRKLKWLLIAALTVCAIALFAGCGTGLGRPTRLEVDETTLTLSWSPVENATNYVIDIGGKQYVSRKPEYSLRGLSDGNFEIKVKAQDATHRLRDSSWSDTLEFTKEYDNGLEYSLTNGNTEYILSKAGATSGEVEIPETYRGLPVTSVAPRAFYQNSRITGVTVGKNVKTIGAYAFANCSQLVSVNFSEGLVSIGEYAFQSSGLNEVALPDSLVSIGEYAFRFCRKITDLSIGNSLSSIGNSVFNTCERISAVTIPASVKSIGETAFSGCRRLTILNLGAGVESIGENAFSGCVELVSVTCGEALSSIGASAFERCAKLTSVSLSDNVKTIGANAFRDCSELSDIRIGDSLTSIGSGAFEGTKVIESGLKDDGVIYADNWVIGCKTLTSHDVIIKDGTVGIAQAAFSSNKEIQSVSLPASVKLIDAYAFSGCENLTGLTIASGGAEKIGNYAFANCIQLGRGQVTLGDSLKTIGGYAFQGCNDLGNPSYMSNCATLIPASVTAIGAYAFRNSYYWKNTPNGIVYVGRWAVGYVKNPNGTDPVIDEGTYGISSYAFYKSDITTVVIPGSVKIIGTSAFQECSQLSAVFFDIMSEITEISDYAFYKCEKLLDIDAMPVTITRIGRSAFYMCGLTSIDIGRRVKEIGPYAFYNCPNIDKVRFSDRSELVTIGDYAFCGAAKLTEIVIPDSVKSIGSRAFSKCGLLASVKLGNSLTELGSFAFNACTSLQSIVLPDTLTKIQEKTFYRCSSLSSVKFGNGVTYIGNYAFYSCASLTELNLPATVIELGNYAFRGCIGLTSLILKGDVQTIGSHVFNGCRYMTVYTDCEERAEGWNGRWNSGYRPVVWGCTFSEDGSYVVSFVKDEGMVSYPNAQNGISAPARAGYMFDGWAATVNGEAVVIDAANIAEVPDGTVLTAIWTVEELEQN